MLEVTFLICLALTWITFAVVQDLRKREIANWLNFSLIVFALGFRFFYSLFSTTTNFAFFYQGLLGLAVFFLLGNLLYSVKMFAGGDAKLMIALGTILPFSVSFIDNLMLFSDFFVIFLFVGALYSIAGSLALISKNFNGFRKELSKQFGFHKNLFFIAVLIAVFFLLIGLVIDGVLIYLGILSFMLPYFYIYSKAVDESCMIKSVATKNLTEGDWLYRDVKVGGKTIKATWNGLRKEEISLLKKKKKMVLIRYGIPFSPVFLISFLILIYLWKNGLWSFLF